MGMPITVEISDSFATDDVLAGVFSYFENIENRFSVFKENSEISKINNGQIKEKDFSAEMKEVFALSEETKKLTDGYFDIKLNNGQYNPSGLVKGWAIYNATKLLKKQGFNNFYVEAGGDIQAFGKNGVGEDWRVEYVIRLIKKK